MKHNVECYSYLIEHTACGRILFCTDLSEFPYKIKNIHHFIIESNYSENIIFDRLYNNENQRSHFENHLSIDKCISVLENNICAETNTITLIHLSTENSDAELFKSMVKQATGFEANIATSGLEVILNKEEF